MIRLVQQFQGKEKWNLGVRCQGFKGGSWTFFLLNISVVDHFEAARWMSIVGSLST